MFGVSESNQKKCPNKQKPDEILEEILSIIIRVTTIPSSSLSSCWLYLACTYFTSTANTKEKEKKAPLDVWPKGNYNI